MEAKVTIDGTELSEGQVMTIRVALNNFASDLQEGLGDDETGKAITGAYRLRISELLHMLTK